MPTAEEEEFERWFARNHPWDWLKAELGKPLPSMARLCIWELCRDAYLKREPATGASRTSERGE